MRKIEIFVFDSTIHLVWKQPNLFTTLIHGLEGALDYYILGQLCRQRPVAALKQEKRIVRHCASSFTYALQSSLALLTFWIFNVIFYLLLERSHFPFFIHWSSINVGLFKKKQLFSVVFCNTYLHNRHYKLFYLWYWIVFKSCNKFNYQ